MKGILHREKTQKTPLVHFSIPENKFQIIGPSFAENISDFYVEVLDWIKENIAEANDEIIVEFHFNMLNSVSLKRVAEILFTFNDEYLNGLNINKVRWMYDKRDLDILEVGEDLSDFVRLPFEFVAV